jgi:hypothetical protein
MGLALRRVRRRVEQVMMPLDGFHNRNYEVVLPTGLAKRLALNDDGPVKLRVPQKQRYKFDAAMWPESATLGSLGLAQWVGTATVPALIAHSTTCALHTFAPGEPLAGRWKYSKARRGSISSLGPVFAQLVQTPIETLPTSRLHGWPRDGDSTGFLLRQVRYTEEEVAPSVTRTYGALLKALNFPADAMARFARKVPELTSRPFVLLHGDLHPGNIILGPDGTMHLVDWELAMVGDPLHELAMHLERSSYRRQNERLHCIEVWRRSVAAVRPQAVRGLEADLPWYIGYQRVRSVYTDLVRTVESLNGLSGAERSGMPLHRVARDLVRIASRGLPWVGVSSQPDLKAITQALMQF